MRENDLTLHESVSSFFALVMLIWSLRLNWNRNDEYKDDIVYSPAMASREWLEGCHGLTRLVIYLSRKQMWSLCLKNLDLPVTKYVHGYRLSGILVLSSSLGISSCAFDDSRERVVNWLHRISMDLAKVSNQYKQTNIQKHRTNNHSRDSNSQRIPPTSCFNTSRSTSSSMWHTWWPTFRAIIMFCTSSSRRRTSLGSIFLPRLRAISAETEDKWYSFPERSFRPIRLTNSDVLQRIIISSVFLECSDLCRTIISHRSRGNLRCLNANCNNLRIKCSCGEKETMHRCNVSPNAGESRISWIR